MTEQEYLDKDGFSDVYEAIEGKRVKWNLTDDEVWHIWNLGFHCYALLQWHEVTKQDHELT